MVYEPEQHVALNITWLVYLAFPLHVAAGSGLSSSAAIVCSSSLAIAAVLGVVGSLTKGDVSEFTCTAERHVGVTSGGMDQAISVMGMPGVAMLVEFNPVSQSNRQILQLMVARFIEQWRSTQGAITYAGTVAASSAQYVITCCTAHAHYGVHIGLEGTAHHQALLLLALPPAGESQ